MVALGVALMMLGALASVWLVAGAGDRVAVLAVGRDVLAGEVIDAGDLVVVDVAADPILATVDAATRDVVVGKVAAVTMRRGELLSESRLTTQAPPLAGQVLVPIALDGDRMPASGLDIGARMLVVDVPEEGIDPVAQGPSVNVVVARVGDPDVNGRRVVDVTAAEADGAALSTRVATGRFALVLLPVEATP